MDCPLEPVTEVNNGEDKVVGICSDTREPLGSVKESDIWPKMSDIPIVPNDGDISDSISTSTLSSPAVQCDLNSNLQPRAKTKGTLRQQLLRKRQQLISDGVAVHSPGRSADFSETKKSVVSPNRGASQVSCYYI